SRAIPCLISSPPLSPSTTDIHSLSLHDALPICRSFPVGCGFGPRSRAVNSHIGEGRRRCKERVRRAQLPVGLARQMVKLRAVARSEEHTSELQSRENLVCRLLLEKKKTKLLSII